MKHSKTKERKKLRPWQRVVIVIAILMLAAGAGFLLFPFASNTVGQIRANVIIDEYKTVRDRVIDPASPDEMPPEIALRLTATTFEEALQKGEVDSEGYVVNTQGERIYDKPVVFALDLDKLRRDSIAYNKSIINHQGTEDTNDYTKEALELYRYGVSNVYGYLEAKTVGLDLPIYLGADDWQMSCGGAHLYGSSLPLDQKDTNVAIAGHTGYIGRIFFDNIRNLKDGDAVTITNYWETIDYEVIGHKTVKANDADDILIQPGRQLLTLYTCIRLKNGENGRYVVICEKK